MLYRPSSLVTTTRTFSMSTGLAASTVTPGNIAPDVSRTMPAMPLAVCCADAADASTKHSTTTEVTTRAHTEDPARIRSTPLSPAAPDVIVDSTDRLPSQRW